MKNIDKLNLKTLLYIYGFTNFNLKVKDFATITENKTSFKINDLIHIGKRYKNNKREFLFINKYLGKHFPVNGRDSLKMFDEFYNEIKNHTKLKDKKILVVGFAETATALAQHIMYKGITDNSLNFIYYTQTTREYIPKELYDEYTPIIFEEEHSHAVSQQLMLPKNLPDYDMVLFIEDEISTGKTILNFIDEFEKISPNKEYAVASVLNFQNETNSQSFKDKNIETIYLVRGKLKDEFPEIKMNNKVKPVELFTKDNQDPDNYHTLSNEFIDFRLGLNPEDFKDLVDSSLDFYKQNTVTYTDDCRIVATEEFMYPAILLAKELNIPVQSTTRSPIVLSNDEKYLIKNGITLSSFYEDKRKTFLYNISKRSKIILVTDSLITGEGWTTVNNYFKKAIIH